METCAGIESHALRQRAAHGLRGAVLHDAPAKDFASAERRVLLRVRRLGASSCCSALASRAARQLCAGDAAGCGEARRSPQLRAGGNVGWKLQSVRLRKGRTRRRSSSCVDWLGRGMEE
eukprot:1735460-Pleurochrysis_carterae.AAC.5